MEVFVVRATGAASILQLQPLVDSIPSGSQKRAEIEMGYTGTSEILQIPFLKETEKG